MVQALIIEDEKNNSERLKRLIGIHQPEIQVLDVAESVSEAVEKIKLLKPQLVFFDVELPDGLSFEIFDFFNEIDFEVIFTTAFDKYALKAIKLSAVDFLIKPIDVNELNLAISKAIKRINNSERSENLDFFKNQINKRDRDFNKIALPTLDGFQFVEIDQIIRCEADGSYTAVFIKDKAKILVSKSLGEFEDLLEEYRFCRIHHSHLINIIHIDKYVKGDGGYVIMADRSQVDVSRRKKDEFLSKINKF